MEPGTGDGPNGHPRGGDEYQDAPDGSDAGGPPDDGGEGEPAYATQSFAFYQGLAPRETLSPSRTDGTTYNMPCIPPEDIEAAEEKTYAFWHGHGETHRFTVTPEDFAALRAGRTLVLYTTVVDGHRHALRIAPRVPCTMAR
jgi:hypothetical protein